MGEQRVNVMISTDPQGQGGVASVVKTMLAQPFAQHWQIRHIASHQAGNKLTLLWVFAQALLQLLALRLKGKPGIAHIHMASRGSFSRKYLLARLAKALGFKIVIHLHGAQFDQFYEKECDSKRQSQVQQLFYLADSTVVLGHKWRDWLYSKFPSVRNVRIIYNPGPEHVAQHCPDGGQTIVFLGRLGERKGVSDLINALPLVAAQIPDINMIFGGDGDISYYQQLAEKSGVSSKARFIGWVGPQEKFSLLASASVFVLPSYNEGFPVGIIEAMACEVPVVASTVGGIPDAITHEKEGLLIEPGDRAALAGALIRLLTDKELAQRLSANAKQKYLQNFSCEAIMPLWHELYMEISNG